MPQLRGTRTRISKLGSHSFSWALRISGFSRQHGPTAEIINPTGALLLPASEKSSSSSLQLSFSSLPYELFHRRWKDLQQASDCLGYWPGRTSEGQKVQGYPEQSRQEKKCPRSNI